MKKSFIISSELVEAGDPSSLMGEIVKGTGSEIEAASVMRSLERLGSHPSVDHYEVSQVVGRRVNGGPASHAWRVRAGSPPDADGEMPPA